jgi:hypothetical protein
MRLIGASRAVLSADDGDVSGVGIVVLGGFFGIRRSLSSCNWILLVDRDDNVTLISDKAISTADSLLATG